MIFSAMALAEPDGGRALGLRLSRQATVVSVIVDMAIGAWPTVVLLSTQATAIVVMAMPAMATAVTLPRYPGYGYGGRLGGALRLVGYGYVFTATVAATPVTATLATALARDRRSSCFYIQSIIPDFPVVDALSEGAARKKYRDSPRFSLLVEWSDRFSAKRPDGGSVDRPRRRACRSMRRRAAGSAHSPHRDKRVRRRCR